MGNLTGLLEWFSDKESQESLCLVIKISRAVVSNLHSEEPVSLVDIWSCSYGTAVPYSTTLWVRNSNIHSGWEVSIGGTQEWAIVPGNQENLCTVVLSAFRWTSTLLEKILFCVSVSQGRQAQTECNVLFSEHQQVQIKPKSHLHKRQLPPAGQHRDVFYT